MVKMREVTDAAEARTPTKVVSLIELSDRLGKVAATELFNRVDPELRSGDVIYAANVRGSRAVFNKVRHKGQAQLVIDGRGAGDLENSVVIIKMDDFEAVVRAGREPFSWIKAFAPRGGLDAATNSARIVKGARGRRQLKS